MRVPLSHCCLFSLQTIRFPVKMTSPPTAILYITEDFEYMTQLKETLHVKEVEIGKENKTKKQLLFKQFSSFYLFKHLLMLTAYLHFIDTDIDTVAYRLYSGLS